MKLAPIGLERITLFMPTMVVAYIFPRDGDVILVPTIARAPSMSGIHQTRERPPTALVRLHCALIV